MVGPGWITHHYSWRVVQVILGLVGLIISTAMYFLFPETSQPGARGIDEMKGTNETDSSGPFVLINPLQSLWLLRSPAILLTVRFYMMNVDWETHLLMTSKGYHCNHISGVCLWWGFFIELGIRSN